MAYSLDANVLIQAFRYSFPFDVAPGFWNAIDNEIQRKSVFIIHDVHREIQKGDDDLKNWVDDRKDEFVVDHRDHQTTSKITALDPLVNGRTPCYRPSAITEFFDCADPWIIAHSMAYNHTVVTEELAAPTRVTRVMIPDVCVIAGVRYIRTMDFLREIGVRLILA